MSSLGFALLRFILQGVFGLRKASSLSQEKACNAARSRELDGQDSQCEDVHFESEQFFRTDSNAPRKHLAPGQHLTTMHCKLRCPVTFDGALKCKPSYLYVPSLTELHLMRTSKGSVLAQPSESPRRGKHHLFFHNVPHI